MNQIVETLVRQLGGQTFALLGAHSKVCDDNSLSFGIRGSRKVNKIKITYNYGSDLYDIDFYKAPTSAIQMVKKGIVLVERCEDIYADSLHDCIERVTGLYTAFNSRN